MKQNHVFGRTISQIWTHIKSIQQFFKKSLSFVFLAIVCSQGLRHWIVLAIVFVHGTQTLLMKIKWANLSSAWRICPIFHGHCLYWKAAIVFKLSAAISFNLKTISTLYSIRFKASEIDHKHHEHFIGLFPHSSILRIPIWIASFEKSSESKSIEIIHVHMKMSHRPSKRIQSTNEIQIDYEMNENDT